VQASSVDGVVVVVRAVATAVEVTHESHMLGHSCRVATPESGSVQSFSMNNTPQRSASSSPLHLGNVDVVVDVDVDVDEVDSVVVGAVVVDVVHEPQTRGHLARTPGPTAECTQNIVDPRAAQSSGSGIPLQ